MADSSTATRLATLPTEVLAPPASATLERARSASDAKILAHLARRVKESASAGTGSSNEELKLRLSHEQASAAERHASYMRSRAPGRIYERQHEARGRLEANHRRINQQIEQQRRRG